MSTREHPKLTGNRCQCSACWEYFNGAAGFDFHRVGEYGLSRRCLTVTEMVSKGYGKNPAGFWVTDSRAQRAARASAAGVSDARKAVAAIGTPHNAQSPVLPTPAGGS
jgi:hypothetical protein